MVSLLDPVAREMSAGKRDWWKAFLVGLVGLFFCLGGVRAYLDSGSNRLPPGMAFGVLFLVLAAQYLLGASSEAKSWLGRTIVLVFLTDILLEIVDAFRRSRFSPLEVQVLQVTGATMLLATACWVAYRLAVRSAARRQSKGSHP